MAFNGFTDRVVQYPGRVTMVPVQGEANTYDMSRSEGTVTTEGTPFNASTFNGIADDIIQEADDNIITSAELSQLATKMGTSDGLYETLDEIADRVIEPIKVVGNVSLTTTGSVAANGTSALIETDVSSSIPSGYDLLFALSRGTGNNNLLFWFFNYDSATNTIGYRVRNVSGTAASSTAVTCNLVCIKTEL